MNCAYEPVTDKYTCTAVEQTQLNTPPPVGEEPAEDLTTSQIAIYTAESVILVMFGGLMSGLTVGLASIDRLSLEIEAKQSEQVMKSAKKIFGVID